RTQGRGIYPMGAEQHQGKEKDMKNNAADKPENRISNQPEMQRIRELLYWEMEGLARTEWMNLVDSQTPTRKAQLARYALEQGWANLSVQATINGKLWNH
ncbi:murein transglycosylase, partial [Morganella morganii]|nr:murein transglycosylase [Morganella morganii]